MSHETYYIQPKVENPQYIKEAKEKGTERNVFI
jgi:hypothetical protein